VDSECVRYASSERLHDTWRVENDRNGHGKYHELDEPGDLTSKEEEDRYDPDDTEEQWPEQTLKVRHQTLRTQGNWSHRGSEMSIHKMSLPGSNDHP
jgi:hypothetical protein